MRNSRRAKVALTLGSLALVMIVTGQNCSRVEFEKVAESYSVKSTSVDSSNVVPDVPDVADPPVGTNPPVASNPPTAGEPPSSQQPPVVINTPPSTQPPLPNVVDGDGGKNPDHENDIELYSCGHGKVYVCHLPSGNIGNRHTICISKSAIHAHLGCHGSDDEHDYLGPCQSVSSVASGN